MVYSEIICSVYYNSNSIQTVFIKCHACDTFFFSTYAFSCFLILIPFWWWLVVLYSCYYKVICDESARLKPEMQWLLCFDNNFYSVTLPRCMLFITATHVCCAASWKDCVVIKYIFCHILSAHKQTKLRASICVTLLKVNQRLTSKWLKNWELFFPEFIRGRRLNLTWIEASHGQ